MWPVTSQLLEGMAEHGLTNYVVEGVILLPHHIRQISQKYPNHFNGCCLGYPNADIPTMTQAIRANEEPDNWMRNAPDDFIAEILTHGIQQSRNIQTECLKEGVAFFDTSANFNAAMENAQNYLLNTNH